MAAVLVTTEGTTEKVRVSAAIVHGSNLNAYLEYVQKNEIPKYEAAGGLASFCVLQRPFVAYVELLIISFWQSEQALTRFLGAQTLAPAATESYGAIQLEPHNYAFLISGKGRIQAAEDASRE